MHTEDLCGLLLDREVIPGVHCFHRITELLSGKRLLGSCSPRVGAERSQHAGPWGFSCRWGTRAAAAMMPLWVTHLPPLLSLPSPACTSPRSLFPCSSMEIGLPEGFPSLSHWLYNQTDTVLQGLVKQGDPQQVIEYSLALITILNEVTQLVLPKRGLQKSLQSPEFLGQVLYNDLCRQGRNSGLYSCFPAQEEAAAHLEVRQG